MINFFLFFQGREKDVLDALLREVLVPVLDELRAQVVGLVDKKDELLIALAHLIDILFQVGRVEKVRIPRIYDLHKHIRLFDDTPKLPPNVDILFKWRNGQSYIVLLHSCDVTAPLKERHVLLLVNLLGRLEFAPLRSARDSQRHVLPAHLLLFALAKEDIDHSGRVCKFATMDNVRVCDDNIVLALGFEIL